jgi:hypothetical protein
MFKEEMRVYWKWLGINSAVGLVFVLANFPHLTRQIALRFLGDGPICDVILAPVDWVQSAVSALVHALGSSPPDALRILMACCFVGLALYGLALIAFMLRHRDPVFLACGAGGLVLGAAALHLISWIALALLSVMTFLARIMGWLANILIVVLAWIIQYWWIWAIIGALVALYIWRAHWWKIILGAIASVAALALLWLLARWIWSWLGPILDYVLRVLNMIFDRFILPLLELLWRLFTWVLLAISVFLVVVGVLCTLGHLVVDQIRAGWQAGDGRRGVLLAAFAIGTAFALVMLTTVANPLLVDALEEGWTLVRQSVDNLLRTDLAQGSLARLPLVQPYVATMPDGVRIFVFQNLTAAGAPIWDAALLAVLLVLSCVGIGRRMVRGLPHAFQGTPVTFYPREYVALFGGLIVQVFLIFLAAYSEGGDS